MAAKKLIVNLVASAACLMLPCVPAKGEVLPITLTQTVDRARVHSVDAEVALNQLRSAYWAYRSYRAELLPELGLSATLPSYRKQYSPYMNAEGGYEFVRNNYLQLDGALTLSQNIWLTGGKVSVTSSLDWYRQLGSGAYNQYMTIPVAVTLTQPLFGVNAVKWNRRIEPVRYEEAQARFLSETEEVAATAIRHYFTLLMARENLEIARQNLDNAVRLHEVAEVKREMGRISRNDLLQMELNLLNARTEWTDRESDYKSAMFALRSFLDYDESVELEPTVPDCVPGAEVPYGHALERAMEHNGFSRQMMLRRLEADYEVAKAKGAQREVSLFAQVGYTGADRTLGGGYRGLRDNQVVQVGFDIPILDWGRRKGNVKVAESRRRLVESQVRQETQNFRQNLFILVERFSNQSRQLETARRADEIAAQRYATNVETFLVGKISTLDLNDSRVKKDEARREFVNELYAWWDYWYRIRSLTLWDYATGRPLEADMERIASDRGF